MNLSDKGLKYWLPNYFIKKLIPREKPDPELPIHLFVCRVDHFEPFNGNVDYKTALKRVLVWKKEYPVFANKHLDSSGKPFQHTWFYPPHNDHRLLPHLVELCIGGYGDIEMHLHHNLMPPFPDTSLTLTNKIRKCIDDYSKLGIFCQPDGNTRFAFIHGDWSLDNSMGNLICGVNDEISILKKCGCYADFTFPCLNKAQPAMINQLYYAFDDIEKPKSYDRGIPVQVGKLSSENGLMIIQGIIGLRLDKNKKNKLSIEYSDLDSDNLPSPSRVDFWVKNSLAVKGKPNWRFIKLHTHGGPERRWDANFGYSADHAFDYLESNYNDGKKYILHYVTAREMYNIIKVAENIIDLSISQAMNYVIKPYKYLI